MRLLDKIGQFLVNLLIVLIVIITFFSIYSFVFINVLDKDYVSIFGYTYFEVVSGSMEPAIGVNDIVIVKLDEEYEKGDIVTYISGGDFVTHRVVEIGIDNVITKGDSNNTRDRTIDSASIIGKVCYVIPNGGVWKDVFMTPKVLVILVITLTLFSFTFSYNTKSKRKRLKKQKERRKLKEIEDAPIKDGEGMDVQ